MPLIETPPPEAAVQAFQAGLSWLAASDERFRDLQAAVWSASGPVPPPHIVEVWGLDGSILARQNFRRTWRFFVSGEQVPLGVVEVAPADEWAGAAEYEFLAFREGPTILSTAHTFARAFEFTIQQPEMGLTFLKLPALGAMFLWLQDLESARSHLKWTVKDWLLAIPPAARGFPADAPEPMPRAVELLKSEVDRVANSEFVRSLKEEQPLFVGEPQMFSEAYQLSTDKYEFFGEKPDIFKEDHKQPPSIGV